MTQSHVAPPPVSCPGCGALLPPTNGPTHRYIGASPGCWALFGEVLAREYSDVLYAGAHRLTVDAYTAQHPGVPSPQSIQSVAVHLLGLHAVLERGMNAAAATRVLQDATAHKQSFTWLEPPFPLGSVTIVDVHGAAGPEEHAAAVQAMARSVWEAWGPHHDSVRRWAVLLG